MIDVIELIVSFIDGLFSPKNKLVSWLLFILLAALVFGFIGYLLFMPAE